MARRAADLKKASVKKHLWPSAARSPAPGSAGPQGPWAAQDSVPAPTRSQRIPQTPPPRWAPPPSRRPSGFPLPRGSPWRPRAARRPAEGLGPRGDRYRARPPVGRFGPGPRFRAGHGKKENEEVVGHLRSAPWQLQRQVGGAGGRFAVINISAPGSP